MRTLYYLLKTTRPVTAIGITTTALASAFLAWGGLPPLDKILALFLASFMLIGAAHTINDIFDRRIDAENPRTKSRPIASGRLDVRIAAIWATLLTLGATYIAYWLKPVCTSIAVLGIILVILYSWRYKRRPIGSLLPALGAFIIPIGAWMAFSDIYTSPIPWLMAGIGFTFELAPYWILTIPDVDYDIRRGYLTFPAAYGKDFTAKLVSLLLILSVILSYTLIFIANLRYALIIFTLVAPLALISAYLMARDTSKETCERAFALSMVYVSIASIWIMLEAGFLL